jgi:hypothetical protein
MDALGNWAALTSDGTTKSRTHDVQNQIQTITGASTPG